MVFTRNVENNSDITVMTDASLATEYDLKSRVGDLIWLGKNFFYGFSKKSTIVCDSSCESELDALNTGNKFGLILQLKLQSIF